MTRAGHNSKVKAGPVNADRLKSFADRIDRLEEEKKALSGDVKDVYTEVKSAGYNAKALRKVLADRRRKSDDELDADMEMYRAALGVPGATYRAVAEQLGVSKSKLQRLVPREEKGTEAPTIAGSGAATTNTAPYDPTVPSTFTNSLEAGAPNPVRDGEASADERDASASSSPPNEHSTTDAGEPGEGGEAVEHPNVAPIRQKPGHIPANMPFERLPQSGDDPGFGPRPESCGERAVALGANAVRPNCTLTTPPSGPQDDLAIPAFLRRAPVPA